MLNAKGIEYQRERLLNRIVMYHVVIKPAAWLLWCLSSEPYRS